MKAFQGKPPFSGSWEEDFDNVISVLNTLRSCQADMCEITSEEKFKAIPVMLQGDTLNFFSNHAHSNATFEESMDLL